MGVNLLTSIFLLYYIFYKELLLNKLSELYFFSVKTNIALFI